MKQLTAWVESTEGELGRILRALGEAAVEITAFAAYGVGASCPIRLQVTNQAKAKKILQGLGIRVTEEEVLRVTLAGKSGLLGNLATRLGDAHINVEYGYATLTKGGKQMDVVLSVSDLAGATKILERAAGGK